MRKLGDIVELVKHGGKPEYDELKFALLAYVSMMNIEHLQLREQLLRDRPQPKFIREAKVKNSFDMYKGALETSPKEWLGMKG
ncbi:hypothetical protein ABE142_20235 [Paenibacillus alvei]|uniref:hypothetical protein n=1 Tax=Paenibacillus alvei TaxID=44250 RepID=UPI0013D9E192|nr:hypothetical protein [Paenibacillus alvei]NEZ45490.1 hypothetical protein [Paenibacillus alvei]